MLDTLEYLRNTDFPPIRRCRLDTLQVNLGYLCNQQCLHCHVDAGPRRKEIMDRKTIDVVVEFIDRHGASILDLTGGAPEMLRGGGYHTFLGVLPWYHVFGICTVMLLSMKSGSRLI